jgi:DNA repair and recombination protein RAD54B
VAQFSRDELRDLFRLDDGLDCQTHELLGCGCGGKGSRKASSVQAIDVVDLTESRECPDSETDSESGDIPIDFPDVATLIKASELSARSQEAQKLGNTIRSLPPDDGIPSRKKKDKMRSLMQYSHIDTSILALGVRVAPDGHKNAPINTDTDYYDAAVTRELESQIDDDVLLSLLRDEGNNVGFLFSKTMSFSGRVVAPDKNKI